MSLLVNDKFFSIQGEGIESGMPTIFVRFAGCPFRCPYCDEPAALTEKGATEYIWEQLKDCIISYCYSKDCFNIELTGGSPEAQSQMEMYAFVSELKNENDKIKVSMQMSGGIALINRLWNIIDNHKVDYKEPSCNIPFLIPLEYFTIKDEVKFVVDIDNGNWNWFIENVNIFENINTNIIVSPKTTIAYPNDLRNAQFLTEKILETKEIKNKSNIRIMPRLQQVYWPNKKGV